MKTITEANIREFREYLLSEEKAQATVLQYVRSVTDFLTWLANKQLEKMIVLDYKTYMCEKYAPASVNAALAALNCFFNYMGWLELKVKGLKIQRQVFASTDKELTKTEYERLLEEAKKKKNKRLYLLMQTICSTGIRVSEVRHITVDALRHGMARIQCKGKCRQVFCLGSCVTSFWNNIFDVSYKINNNKTVTVTFAVKGTVKFCGMEGYVELPAGLTFESLTQGEGAMANYSGGAVYFTFTTPSATNTTKETTIMTVTLSYTDSFTSAMLNTVVSDIYDQNFQPVDNTTIGGEIKVK